MVRKIADPKSDHYKKTIKTNKRKVKTWITSIIVLLVPIGFFVYVYIFQEEISEFLAITKKTKADILIYEGWLPESAIGLASREFKMNNYNIIVTTGLKSNALNFCIVPMNGYLIFYPSSGLLKDNEVKAHLIEILAHSEMGGKYSSHFSIYVNDSLIADFIADQKVRKYAANWSGALKNIDSLMVQFDDDYLDEGGDKNLYIREIIIDNKFIIPYKFNSIYDIGKLGGTNRIKNDYDSYSEISRNNLISTGIDSLSVVAVTGKSSGINRTLTSALAFRNWLRTYNGKVNGVNIISLGIHSRRTFETYQSILGKKLNVGIISVNGIEKPDSGKLKYGNILSELLSLMYYKIILIPYSIFKQK